MTSGAETIRVNREERKTEQVKAQYNKLNLFHMKYVLNSMKQNESKAHNIQAVLITSLYNSANTLGSYYGNLVQYHTANSELKGGGQTVNVGGLLTQFLKIPALSVLILLSACFTAYLL